MSQYLGGIEGNHVSLAQAKSAAGSVQLPSSCLREDSGCIIFTPSVNTSSMVTIVRVETRGRFIVSGKEQMLNPSPVSMGSTGCWISSTCKVPEEQDLF